MRGDAGRCGETRGDAASRLARRGRVRRPRGAVGPEDEGEHLRALARAQREDVQRVDRPIPVARHLQARARRHDLAKHRRLARVERVRAELVLDLAARHEVDASLEDAVADAEIRVGDLADQVAAAALYPARNVVQRGAVPRTELQRPPRVRSIEQAAPVLLLADGVVPGVLYAVGVVAKEDKGCDVVGERRERVVNNGGERRRRWQEPDAPRASHLPVVARLRQQIVA
mmetsp:Transcript_16624/g.50275  ORF Transcript_16624/g.50275 Transcript_16624/m.50275 type:complete len:229 (-) Transcript_16624:366-1052(-)